MCKCHCVYHTDAIQVLGYRPFDPLISRRFRQLCGCSELVPISYTIPGEQITTVEKYPIATGGFGDVWKCAYNGRRVAVKACASTKMRICIKSNECGVPLWRSVSSVRSHSFC